jgi:hypothetical protein
MEGSEFYRSDPLARLLKDKLRLTPVNLALLWTGTVLCVGFFTSLFSSVLFSQGEKVGFLQDWVGWVWNLFFTPVLAGYYLWSADAIAGVIRELQESDTVDISVSDVGLIMDAYQRPWRKLVSVGVAVIAGVLYFLGQGYFESYSSAALAPRIGLTVTSTVGAYGASMLILTFITNGWALWRILRDKEFDINPLHPDRCGGLKAMSTYSLRTAFMVAVFGMVIGLSEYRAIVYKPPPVGWAVHFSIPLYIVAAPACFFAPLTTAHAGMEEAKGSLLNNIAQQFRHDYLRLHNELGGDAEVLKQGIAKIQQLQTLYELTSRFPVWPYDVGTLRTFLTSITSPLLPPIIGLLVAFLKKILAA